MIRYAGILDGGNLATGNIRDRESVLTFESLDASRTALRDADGSRGQVYTGFTLDGGRPLPIPGGLGEGAQLTLWILPLVSPLIVTVDDAGRRSTRWATAEERAERAWRQIADDPDPYPDYILTIGARGGVHTEKA